MVLSSLRVGHTYIGARGAAQEMIGDVVAAAYSLSG
jgi:hypothetical protein